MGICCLTIEGSGLWIEKSFLSGEFDASLSRERVKGRSVEFVNNGDLEEVHLRCDDDHGVRPNLHPIGLFESKGFTCNHNDVLPLIQLLHTVMTPWSVLAERGPRREIQASGLVCFA